MRPRPRLAAYLSCAAAAVVSLLVRVDSPLVVLGNAFYDDALFGKLAGHVAAGEWLGSFDKMTLVKGPTYPMFIATAYQLHLPLPIAEQLLYLVASAVLALAFGLLARSHTVGAVLFVALALNPAQLGDASSRLAREVIYGSLSMLLVGELIVMLLVLPTLCRRLPGAVLLVTATAFGVVIGATAAAYWACREERAWIVPTLPLAVAAGVWCWPRLRRRWLRRWRPGLNAAVALGAAVLIAVGTASFGLHEITRRNEAHYGVGTVTDMADGQFARAYALWQSVQAGPTRRYVPVSAAQRRAVYAVSPAARELEPYLEGISKRWFPLGCRRAHVCDDYIGAFFAWALREDAELSGHFRSEREFQEFFRTVADQISAACSHALHCGSSGAVLVPSLGLGDAGDVLRSSASVTAYALSFAPARPSIPVPTETKPGTWRQVTAAIRGVQNQEHYLAEERASAQHQIPVRILRRLYQFAAYPACLLALLGLVLGLVRGRGPRRAAALGCLALLTAALSRIVLVGVLDAVSFPSARTPAYALPAMDFLVAFAAVGSWLAVLGVRDLLRRRDDAGTAEPPSPFSSPEPEPEPEPADASGLRPPS